MPLQHFPYVDMYMCYMNFVTLKIILDFSLTKLQLCSSAKILELPKWPLSRDVCSNQCKGQCATSILKKKHL
jgi:hypothetical protein